MYKDIYELNETPPLGVVPEKMYACCIREERFGDPETAMQTEKLPVPEKLGDHEVLVYVVASGINYNGVWAASGQPLNVIRYGNKLFDDNADYFIPGSEATGIIWKTGPAVKDFTVGDAVIVSSMSWRDDDPGLKAGLEPEECDSYCVLGYERNYGTFAQFSRVNAGQCVRKPDYLGWQEAAACTGGIGFLMKMLMGQPGFTLKENDPVLIWGAAGNVGQNAIQLCNYYGARPIAIVSNQEKYEYCKDLGAHGVINHSEFTHWGKMPDCNDQAAYIAWVKEVRRFQKHFYEVLGEHKNPKIVIEHPGESTLPTSIYMVDSYGMVVICGGTSGYYGSLDLRYLWLRSKRLQGCHGMDAQDSRNALELLEKSKLELLLSKKFRLDETGLAHQMMLENKAPTGNMVVVINEAIAQQDVQ